MATQVTSKLIEGKNMNLLSSIAHFLSIRDKAPLPVHFSYIEPMVYPLPSEVAKRYFKNENQELLTSYVGLENFSTKVLKDIRVKLKSPLGFYPKVKSNERGKDVDFEFDDKSLEVFIKQIDPGESLYLNLFPSPALLSNDFEPQVIIDGELLTRGMKRMGYYRKYPLFLLLNLLLLSMVTVVGLSFIWGKDAIDYLRNIDPEYVLIEESQERLAGTGCSQTVIEGKSDFEWYLERSPMPIDFTLRANGVKSYEELLLLSKAVVCLPKSVNK